METFITILILLTIVISCYYINRFIVKIINKAKYEYGWNEVKTNLLMSIFVIPSIVYWIIYIVKILPALPEEPPRWL
jgi:hypothetical protein